MKYVILHAEGLAGRPCPELDGKTPLQAADTPNMDMLGRIGELGLVAVQADGRMQGQEVTPLGLLGYDPRKYLTGPAAFEAAGLGVALGEQDVAFRCNMVTLIAPGPAGRSTKEVPGYSEIKKIGPQVVLEDDTAGGITTEEARELIDAVNEQLGSETIQFYPGTGHRHLMVWVGGTAKATCVDPHELLGRALGDTLPKGEGADILRKLMDASFVILATHPVNEQRREAGLKPSNCLWLWGPGKAPKLPKLPDRFHIEGTVLTTSDLVRGVGVSAGLEAVSPEELSENGGANLTALSERALRELERKDFLYFHLELPVEEDEMEAPKLMRERVEEFDRQLVGSILDGLKKAGDYRLLLVGGGHSYAGLHGGGSSPVLYALVQGPAQKSLNGARGFNESDATSGQVGARDAAKLAARLFAAG